MPTTGVGQGLLEARRLPRRAVYSCEVSAGGEQPRGAAWHGYRLVQAAWRVPWRGGAEAEVYGAPQRAVVWSLVVQQG
jgi:hypothetical protein